MKLKLTLDAVLLLLFGVMCNTGATGTQFHEVAGLAYAALIGLHLVLNRKWIVAALKRKMRGRRSAWMSAVNIALLVDLIVILATGIRASHYLFPAAVKASSAILVTHAVCGVIAAGLVLAHVLFHAKAITKNKAVPKVALVAVLTVVIGYSLFGGVQGALHHGLPKDGEQKNQHEQRVDDGNHKTKEGEQK
jgi:hypothetical protein